MERFIEKQLFSWKNQQTRRPLLIRGARQIGKSYSVRKFGNEYFTNYVEIDFEFSPQLIDCFNDLDPHKICEKLSILTGVEIIEGETLLFLDEIQRSPNAIKALRYFFEKMPNLHIIGAGSLLEFTLESEMLEIPVGRIQYIYMKPFSFYEFCIALNENKLVKHLQENIEEVMPSPIHDRLNELIKKYSIIGGMPAVIEEYITTGDMIQCQRIQTSIVQTYRDDFGKYANKVKHKYLDKIFNYVSKSVGSKIKYSNIDKEIQSRELKEAFDLLEKAGILTRVKATSGDGLPLEAGVKERHFKSIFLDIGLMQNLCGYSGEIIQAEDILSVHRGAVAEQFVGQELLANMDPYQRPSLYYWIREAKSSNAEVDYLIQQGSTVVPIEVKSGTKGKLKSLNLFINQYGSSNAYVFSQREFYQDKEVRFYPFYSIGSLFFKF